MWGYRVAFTKINTAPECPRWDTRAHRVTQLLHPEPSFNHAEGPKASLVAQHFTRSILLPTVFCFARGLSLIRGVAFSPGQTPATDQPSCSVVGCLSTVFRLSFDCCAGVFVLAKQGTNPANSTPKPARTPQLFSRLQRFGFQGT